MLQFLAFLTIIRPESPEFRVKIKRLEEEIKAYEFLDKEIKESLSSFPKQIIFKEPPNFKISVNKYLKIYDVKKMCLYKKDKIVWFDGLKVVSSK